MEIQNRLKFELQVYKYSLREMKLKQTWLIGKVEIFT